MMDREPHACVIGAPKSTIRDTVTVLHGLWNLPCLGPGTLHAVYWFASGKVQDATGLWIAFFVAEGVIGFLAAIWFLSRSRSFSA